jgi:hypothetical protein
MFWSVQFPGEDFVRVDRVQLLIYLRLRPIELKLSWIWVLVELVILSDSWHRANSGVNFLQMERPSFACRSVRGLVLLDRLERAP